MNDILYGKIQLDVPENLDGETATITSPTGTTRIITTHSPKTDIYLPGLEQYRIQSGVVDETVSLDYGEMKKIRTHSLRNIKNIRGKYIASGHISICTDSNNDLYLVLVTLNYSNSSRTNKSMVRVYKYDYVESIDDDDWTLFREYEFNCFFSNTDYQDMQSSKTVIIGDYAYCYICARRNKFTISYENQLAPGGSYYNYILVIGLKEDRFFVKAVNVGNFANYGVTAVGITNYADNSLIIGGGQYYGSSSSYSTYYQSNTYQFYQWNLTIYTSISLSGYSIASVGVCNQGYAYASLNYIDDKLYMACYDCDYMSKMLWGYLSGSSWVLGTPDIDGKAGTASTSASSSLFGGEFIKFNGEFQIIGGYIYNTSGTRHAVLRNGVWRAVSSGAPPFQMQSETNSGYVVKWNNAGIREEILAIPSSNNGRDLYIYDGTSWTKAED